MPSFGRRRVATPFVSAQVLTTAPALSLVSFLVDEEEIYPHDANSRPHKRKVVDVGEGVPTTVDILEDEIVVQDTMTVFIGKGVGRPLRCFG